MKNRLRASVLVVSSGLSALFFYGYYASYFKREDCFNELGRCFDSETGVVYLEQSGVAWLSLAVLASGVALYQLWRLIH
jgi:hypothetical protein